MSGGCEDQIRQRTCEPFANHGRMPCVVFMPQNELLMRTFAKEGLMVEEGKLNMYMPGRNKQIKAQVLRRDEQDSPRTNSSLPPIFLKGL